MNPRLISSAFGIILIAFGAIFLLPIIVAFVEEDASSALPFLVASLCSLTLGLFCRWHGRTSRNFDALKRTEGLLIVTLTWIVVAAIGAIPFVFSGLSPLDAYFESVSGFTTTGATILIDFTLYPKAFFFWRSLIQWLGGMGIIVLFVAILPQFGVAGRRIFFAEAPGPTEEKFTPRVAHTAKALWLIYLLLTLLEIVCLVFAGMPLFDAICNSFTTMAAGGFSPNPQSIMGYQSSAITWIVTLFMVLAGANFALQYKCFIKGKGRALFTNDEFLFYLAITIFSSLFLAAILFTVPNAAISASLRDSTFQVASILTTTGFASADFALWAIPAQTVLFAMMLIGGCAGSAGGGVKVIRVLFIGRFLKREIDQIIHPKAVLPIKIDRVTVPEDIQRQMLSFVLFYLVLMLFSGLVVTMIEQNAIIGFIGTAATLGNIGPGFGDIGPMASFGNLHWVSKSIFILDMIVGRLELIPFLAMLCPEFWTFSRT
ncbi:MAG: TrkH family potassium uptake protein [Proteobacteria bacterium]|nr:TrkH family potassium uptake protein [Pseudomonadota bacterium]